MKKIIALAVFLPLVAAAQPSTDKPFTINGKLTRLANKVDWIYIQYRTGGDWKTDSVQPKNDAYIFKGVIGEPTLAHLRVKYVNPDAAKRTTFVNKRDRGTVFLQPAVISVASIDSFSNIQVKGSAVHVEYAKLVAQAKPYQDKTEPLYALYSQFSRAKEITARERVEAMIDSIEKQMNDVVYGEYAKKYPASPIAMYALKQYAGWEIDADKVEPVYAKLSAANRQYPSGVEFKQALEIAKKTGIGKMAMDFTQNDTSGIPVTLASLKGKYLLIDFWASWCGPCRAENPNVVKVFNKYKDKGFHIIGVSLDRPGQKEKWLKAIHDDGLTWTQVSDLKFWDNEVAKQYGIQAIPQNLLLDPEGKIIAKNVTGEELDHKVAEAIEGKKAF